jgi:spore maturation protein CgeB
LHSSPFHEGVNPDGDYLNPRTFELASAGAFQLVDERSLLSELFEPDREIITFKNEKELRDKITYYLNHPDDRKVIAERARQRILAEHTYEKRMSDMLNYIFCHEEMPVGRRHPDHIDNLLESASDDEELKDMLQRFKDCGVITLDEITKDIRSRQGKLNQTEITFLLMYEFRRWAQDKGAL